MPMGLPKPAAPEMPTPELPTPGAPMPTVPPNAAMAAKPAGMPGPPGVGAWGTGAPGAPEAGVPKELRLAQQSLPSLVTINDSLPVLKGKPDIKV